MVCDIDLWRSAFLVTSAQISGGSLVSILHFHSGPTIMVEYYGWIRMAKWMMPTMIKLIFTLLLQWQNGSYFDIISACIYKASYMVVWGCQMNAGNSCNKIHYLNFKNGLYSLELQKTRLGPFKEGKGPSICSIHKIYYRKSSKNYKQNIFAH